MKTLTSEQVEAIRRKLAKRKRLVLKLMSELHAEQLKVVHDKARWKALLCSRRAGKTELCARLIAIALINAGRGHWVLFGARTLAIAKDLIWSHLETINEGYRLRWKMNASLGTITTPSGARFRLIGVDDSKSVQKVRGYKVKLAIFDEASTYAEYLLELIRDCLSPALTDLAGELILSGTPGPVCAGYWFEASTGVIERYSKHSWTVLQNPKFPRDPHEMLREEREANKWEEDDPAYQREYFALWVDDPTALVYKFVRARNTCEWSDLPIDRDAHSGLTDEEIIAQTWLVTLGIDYGFTDEAGWVVLGSPPHSRDVYVLHAEKHSGLLPAAAADLTQTLVAKWRPVRVVGDGGGLGKPYVEEFNRRFQEELKTTVHPADKSDKPGFIKLMNGDIRRGTIKAVNGKADDWCREAQHLPWLDAGKTKEHPAYPNHCCDAALYAWRVHTSYWQTPAPKTKTAEQIEQEKFRARQRKAQQNKSKGLAA